MSDYIVFVVKMFSIYLTVEFVSRIFLGYIIKENHSISRGIIVLITFIYSLFRLHILERNDFYITRPFFFFLIVIFMGILGLMFKKTAIDQKLLFSALVFAPIIEEIICRKIILQGLDGEITFFKLSFSLIIFVLLHFNLKLEKLIFFLLAGLLLSLTQYYGNKITDTIILHSFMNLIILLTGLVWDSFHLETQKE